MTIIFQDGFDYDSKAVLADRGWHGTPFGFIPGRIQRPGYPSYAIEVILNNDVSHDLPDFGAGVVGFAQENRAQAPLWGGARIAWLYQTVTYYTCDCDRDCNCVIGETNMLTGVGLNEINRLYSFCTYPTFESCGSSCPCTLKHTGNVTEIIGSGDVLDFNVWNYIEFKADGGSIEVHLNGAAQIGAGGLPTLDPCAHVSGYQKIVFGISSLGSGQGIDDVYVLDTSGPTNNDYLGDVHIETLVPDADGTYSEWTPKTGVDHWDMVNETPPDGNSTFNYAEKAGSRDSYSLLPLPATVTQVFNVQANVDVQANSADVRRGQILIRQGGVDYYMPLFDFSRGAYGYVGELLNQDPTNTNWSISTINADEWGLRLVDGGGGSGRPGEIEPSFVGVGTVDEGGGSTGGLTDDSFFWADVTAPMWPPFDGLGGGDGVSWFITSRADLDDALANAAPGDVIIIDGSFTIHDTYEITGVHGTRNFCTQLYLGWPGQYPQYAFGAAGAGLVTFDYNGGGNHPAVYIHDCSYLKIFGGKVTNGGTGGSGILLQGPLTGIQWWDFYAENVGTHSINIRPKNDAGSASSIDTIDLRGVVYKWGQDTSRDTSSEAGTDLHGLNIDGSDNPSEVFHNAQITLSTPTVGWPVGWLTDGGPTGNLVNIKSSQSTFNMSNLNFCLLGYGLNKVSTSRPAGNLFHVEGNAPIKAYVAWAELHDSQGRVIDGQGLASSALTDGGNLRVAKGRHYNTNQNANLSTIEPGEDPAQPYDDRWHIYYGSTL